MLNVLDIRDRFGGELLLLLLPPTVSLTPRRRTFWLIFMVGLGLAVGLLVVVVTNDDTGDPLVVAIDGLLSTSLSVLTNTV